MFFFIFFFFVNFAAHLGLSLSRDYPDEIADRCIAWIRVAPNLEAPLA